MQIAKVVFYWQNRILRRLIIKSKMLFLNSLITQPYPLRATKVALAAPRMPRHNSHNPMREFIHWKGLTHPRCSLNRIFLKPQRQNKRSKCVDAMQLIAPVMRMSCHVLHTSNPHIGSNRMDFQRVLHLRRECHLLMCLSPLNSHVLCLIRLPPPRRNYILIQFYALLHRQTQLGRRRSQIQLQSWQPQ